MTEHLIDTMVSNLKPVRRYRSPWLRAAGFLAFAAILGLMVAILHQKAFSPEALSEVPSQPTLYGALFTGVLAAIAAFLIGQPDRSRWWWVLPLPAMAVWLGSMGYQCLTNWASFGPEGMTSGETAQCFATLFVMAAPLGLAAALMLKTMSILEPARITVLASLAVAGLTAAAMDIFHPADASVLILLFNLGTAGLLLAAGWLVKRASGQS